MREVLVVLERTGETLAERTRVADSWWRRLRGLLGRPPLTEGEGMLLLDCRSVHTAGMRRAIDVAFVDAEGRVVKRCCRLEPWRVGTGGEGAMHALELPAGRLDRTRTFRGDRLIWS